MGLCVKPKPVTAWGGPRMSEATLSHRDRVPKDTGEGAVGGCGRGRMWGEGLEEKGECLLERKGKDGKERQGP